MFKMYFKILPIIIFVVLLAENAFAQLNRAKVNKAVRAYQSEQWDESLQHFQDALIDDPGNPVGHFNVGDALYQKKQYEEAIQSFEKSLASEDLIQRARAYYNLGNTQYRMDKIQEAIQSYIKALELNPQDQDAKYNLELVRAKLKENSRKQQQQQEPQNQKIEPSEYAKKLKEQSDILVTKYDYIAADQLMQAGLKKDKTVMAYQDYMKRLGEIHQIEGGR